MNAIAKLVLAFTGTVLIASSTLVYEDPENQIQSKLADWWIRLDDQSKTFFANERRKLGHFASFVSSAIDHLLGPRILSLRAIVGTSLISYAAMFCAGVYITGEERRTGWVLTFLLCCCYAIFLIILNTRSPARAAVCFLVLCIALTLNMSRGLPFREIYYGSLIYPRLNLWLIVAGATMLSLWTDLLVLAISRRLIKVAASADSLPEALIAFIIVAACSVAAWYVPLWLSDLVGASGIDEQPSIRLSPGL
jgi:hypothetical protein